MDEKVRIDFRTITDGSFDALLPKHVQQLSVQQWTPVQVARRAAEFLATKQGMRVLDIGSGPGKFCLVGAGTTKGYFTGVEQRMDLHRCALALAAEYHLLNVQFINDNITNIDFTGYEAFYFANSFYENISSLYAIDGQFPLTDKLFHSYNQYMRKQLEAMPKGTKMATYWEVFEVPPSYRLVGSEFEGLLNLWRKA